MSHNSNTRKRARLSKEQEIEEDAKIIPSVSSLETEFKDLNIKAWISNTGNLLAIQDDDQIFSETFEKTFPKNLNETVNGVSTTRDKYFTFLQTFRSTVTDRFLLNQHFFVVPSGTTGGLEAGNVAHSVQIIGFTRTGQKTTKVVFTIIALLNIQVIKGRRQVAVESFIEKMEEL